MYVKVKYFSEIGNCYAGMPYSYATQLPLNVGDVVLAPTAKAPEGSRAIVVETFIPAPSFKCKEITRLYQPEG